jgi:hypothetical protein
MILRNLLLSAHRKEKAQTQFEAGFVPGSPIKERKPLDARYIYGRLLGMPTIFIPITEPYWSLILKTWGFPASYSRMLVEDMFEARKVFQYYSGSNVHCPVIEY